MKFLIVANVNLRKQPRVTWTNRVGMLEAGRTVEALEITRDKRGWAWAAINRPNAHGERVWFCVNNLNKTFAKRVNDLTASEFDAQAEIESLRRRVARLEEIAGLE